jgi:hypothetical protein
VIYSTKEDTTMAKCTAPAMSAETRGRVGGLVYNTWRGVRYVKIKTGPAQPRSQKQLQIRSWAIMLARKWQTLLLATQDNWREYARTHTTTDFTNTPVRATGSNWYVALNTRLLSIPKAIIDQPPAAPAPAPLDLFTAAGASGQIDLTWTATADWGDYVQVFLQGPHSPGAIGSLPKARFKVWAQGPSGALSITSLGPGTYDVWARVCYQDTGLVSTWVTARAAVT